VVADRRGRGYATEAVLALVARAFERGATRVLAHTRPDNLPSIAVLTKCRFRPSAVEANPQTGAARFVAAMVADPGVADSVPDGFLFWWDPLAAVAATTHNVVRYESDRITVVQSGPQQGALVAGSTGASMRVGIFADQQKFQSVFFRRLNATPHHHDD